MHSGRTMDFHKIQIASLNGETASIDVQGARVLLTVDNGVQLNLSESEAWALSLQLKLACRRAAKASWFTSGQDDEPSGGPP
jgi:hypothetical protein